MRTRLILISHAATPAMREGRFPADDPLDARGIADATASRQSMPIDADALALCSPATCALETAHALGLAVRITTELAEANYGRWRGRRLADIAVDAPSKAQAWSCDPDTVPPDGESFDQVLARVGRWLDNLDETGNVVAITHASVIRAAVIHALNAPSSSLTRVEVAPLSVIELRRSGRGWAWWPAQSRSR
ncbi:histidine phosphatase family protein [Caballeronia sp.]|uniref:histidine phosphatase family protein n=1 Tax=Caballeronia sp. TaxID=1931223 RepID=UPI003C6835C3